MIQLFIRVSSCKLKCEINVAGNLDKLDFKCCYVKCIYVFYEAWNSKKTYKDTIFNCNLKVNDSKNMCKNAILPNQKRNACNCSVEHLNNIFYKKML